MNEPDVSPETCPDCGSKFYRDGHCLVCPTRRMIEQHEQMRQHSGPEYEKAVSRARTGAAAWRAAGSPVKVTLVHVGSHDTDGNYHSEPKWYLSAAMKRGQSIEATTEQVDAWYAWHNKRSGDQ